MNDIDIEDTRQPPDEPEARYCDDCGEEVDSDCSCNNVFCPSRFSGVPKEMAVEIVELKEKVSRLELQLKQARNRS